MNTTIITIHNSESLYEGIATTVNELLAADWLKDSDLISNHQDRYYHGDPNDTDNIYNNIQPGAYEDYDLSYLHK